MLIRFLAKHKKGQSAQAVRIHTKIESIKIKDKKKRIEAHNVQWIVFDENGDEHFYTEEQFKAVYDVQNVKLSCEPVCTHLELKRSSKDWYIATNLMMYRCQECGTWYLAQKG